MAQKPVIAPAPTREAETNGGPTQTDTKVTKPATEEPAPAARRPKAKPTPAAAPSKPRTAPPARANAAAADDRQRQQDLYFLNIAATVRDVPPGGFDAPGTRPTANPNGAVLVVADGRVISTGYDSTLTTGGGCLHAELVAILNAARSGAPVEGATLYTTCRPCIDCMQAAIHAGVKRILFLEDASACLTAKTRAEYSILARLLNEFVHVEDPTGRAQPARRTQQRE
jgi:deoxycytidylate deaminase